MFYRRPDSPKDVFIGIQKDVFIGVKKDVFIGVQKDFFIGVKKDVLIGVLEDIFKTPREAPYTSQYLLCRCLKGRPENQKGVFMDVKKKFL